MKKLKFESVTTVRATLEQNLDLQVSQIKQFLKSSSREQLLIPIPLHHKRYIDRGYNQVAFFADYLEKNKIGKVFDNLLVKVSNSKSQSHKVLTERGYLGENPFVVNKEALINFAKNKDPVLILVDDVITTGNTLIMASKVLKAQFPSATIKAIALFRPVFKGEKK